MKANLSTHVLNSAIGKPAAGIAISLYTQNGELLAEAVTNDDGRVSEWQGNVALLEGNYRLVFAVGEYFLKNDVTAFYPEVIIQFTIADANQHYHVPLLLGPYSYSTYRGS